MPTYDALLVLSFGGPEGMGDVIPFLENVLRGRDVPRSRLEEVAEHYAHFGGVSPINAQNRALIAALEDEFAARGVELPIYFGNRNWHPFLTDTLRQMRDDGVRRVLAFFTSAYSSYSGCRQYREDIARAQAAVGDDAPQVDVLRKFYNHAGFVQPNAEAVRAALEQLPAERRADAHIAFTAHSIPSAMAAGCAYQDQLTETMHLVMSQVGNNSHALVYQSRSGAPHIPWLEPDINDHLREIRSQNLSDVVIAPIGFISDHVEVMYDLDSEAMQTAAQLGLNVVRAATVGTHPAFIRMIADLVHERMTDAPIRVALGERGASHDICPATCCLPGHNRPLPAAAAQLEA
jgi:ferrochelatase